MTKIDRFESHINEALGIAEATLFYVDIIKSRAMIEILDYINDNEDINKKEVHEIRIPYTNIRRFITDWDLYSHFPVSEIVLYLGLIKKERDKLIYMDELGNYVRTTFKVGGSAYPFAKGREKEATRVVEPIKMNVDHSLSIHMGLDIEYSTFSLRDEKKLEVKVESVLLHELNHLYEFYCRKFNYGKQFGLATTWAAIGPNKRRRPKKIWDYWQYFFTDLIYMAEPHEVRASIQESKAYVDKLELAAFKRTKTWKTAKKMENFSYKNFVEEFNKVIATHNPDYVDKIIDMLIKDFIKEYEDVAEEFKEKPIISISKFRKMSKEGFFEFWEKRIKKAGETIVKGILRLYALKKREEDEII